MTKSKKLFRRKKHEFKPYNTPQEAKQNFLAKKQAAKKAMLKKWGILAALGLTVVPAVIAVTTEVSSMARPSIPENEQPAHELDINAPRQTLKSILDGTYEDKAKTLEELEKERQDKLKKAEEERAQKLLEEQEDEERQRIEELISNAVEQTSDAYEAELSANKTTTDTLKRQLEKQNQELELLKKNLETVTSERDQLVTIIQNTQTTEETPQETTQETETGGE